MPQTPSDSPLARPTDILVALSLLTRFPLPAALPGDRAAAATWAYPLAGALVGAVAAITGGVAVWFGVPDPLAAGLALATAVAATGALHEDGLADSADGFWGGATPARRLEIMRDSRIGSYGVIALVLSLILRWAALTTILSSDVSLFAALIAAGALSRAPLPALMHLQAPARADGLSQSTGRPGVRTMWLGLAVAALIGLFLIGWPVVWIAVWAGLVVTALAALAQARIGGQTGDTLGASQQVAEITVLCVLTALPGV